MMPRIIASRMPIDSGLRLFQDGIDDEHVAGHHCKWSNGDTPAAENLPVEDVGILASASHHKHESDKHHHASDNHQAVILLVQ